MQAMCNTLQELLSDAYKSVYRASNASFHLVPMHRLEIQSMEDLKVLSEIGGITPDMSLQLSQLILGDDMRRGPKKTQHSALGADGVAALKSRMRGDKHAEHRESDEDPNKRQRRG